jgi:methyltransferase family protein
MGYTRDNIVRIAARNLCIVVGQHTTAQQVQALHGMLNYVEVSRWLKARGYGIKPRFSTREALHAHVAKSIQDERVLYLEFGVFNGTSLRMWSRFLRNPGSSLHGFDSFEGLPENWHLNAPKGAYRAVVPQFDDSRITLHPGWFHETLPRFDAPDHDRLVIHLDADLYSSTKCALDGVAHLMRPGSIVLFGEFHDRLHELKAFTEFLEETGMRFQFLGSALYLSLCAFERLA